MAWGLLLTLSRVSLLVFAMTWHEEWGMTPLVGLARQTLILVPLGLPLALLFTVATETG
jgi:hypothetical protein